MAEAYDDFFAGGGFVGSAVSPQGVVVDPQQGLSYDLAQQIKRTGKPSMKTLNTLSDYQEAEAAQKMKVDPAMFKGLNFDADTVEAAGKKWSTEGPLAQLQKDIAAETNRLNFARLRNFDLARSQFPEPETPGTMWPQNKDLSRIRDWVNDREAQFLGQGYSKGTALARAMAEARTVFAEVSPDAINSAIPVSWRSGTQKDGLEIGAQRGARMEKADALKIMNDDNYAALDKLATEYVEKEGQFGQPNLTGFVKYLQDYKASRRASEKKGYTKAEMDRDLRDDVDRISLIALLKGIY